MNKLLKNTDYIILTCIIILSIIGVIAIYSAGYSTDVNKDEYIKQIIWLCIIFVMIVGIWLVDTSSFQIAGYILYISHIALLVGVLFTGSLMGASSWFNLGGMLYQPSELMKVGFIICMAKLMSNYCAIGKSEKKKKKRLFLMMCIVFLLPVALILLQPDFGTAIVFFFITAFMVFKMGIKYRYVALAILLIAIMVPIVYCFVLSDYQQNRIKVFLNPELDPTGSGYNALQSKIAVGSGMLFGTGFLKGTQTQLGYIPIKTTDFIYSVISEEFGFVVSVLIVVIFAVLIIRMIWVSRKARDDFSSYIVIGVTGMIFFHFLENIGMTIGLMPITGVPLPFVSYGGSNLLTNGLALGMVLNISARRPKDMFFD